MYDPDTNKLMSRVGTILQELAALDKLAECIRQEGNTDESAQEQYDQFVEEVNTMLEHISHKVKESLDTLVVVVMMSRDKSGE